MTALGENGFYRATAATFLRNPHSLNPQKRVRNPRRVPINRCTKPWASPSQEHISGLDVSSIISTLIQADSIPITNLQTTDTTLQAPKAPRWAHWELEPRAISASRCKTSGQTRPFQHARPPTGFPTPQSVNRHGRRSARSARAPPTSTSRSSPPRRCCTAAVRPVAAFADSQSSPHHRRDQHCHRAPCSTRAAVDGQTFTVNGKQITLSQAATRSTTSSARSTARARA